jgi:hypothetical protein
MVIRSLTTSLATRWVTATLHKSIAAKMDAENPRLIRARDAATCCQSAPLRVMLSRAVQTSPGEGMTKMEYDREICHQMATNIVRTRTVLRWSF